MRKRVGWLAGALFLLAVIVSGSILGHSYTGTDDKVAQVIGQFNSPVVNRARPPFINTDQGDLLLFLFTASGVIGGFFLGYKWREFFGPRLEAGADREGAGHDD